ncbi:MAG: SdpI family protein [Mycobacterium leprae]
MTEPTYRVDRKLILADWPILLLLIANLVFSIWVYPKLPAQVPVHFGANGVANRFGPAWEGAFMTPLMAIGLYFLMLYAPIIDPRRRNYANFPGALKLFRWALVMVLTVIHLTTVWADLGNAVRINMVVPLAIGALFALLGNQMGRIRHNYFMGIRTPWTLANEQVWTQTHRFAGRIWVVCGLGMMLAALLPAPYGSWLMVVAILATVLGSVLYSYVAYRRVTKE